MMLIGRKSIEKGKKGKMTYNIKQHTTRTHYITMETDGKKIIVQACPLLGNGICSYPHNEAFYPMADEIKAKATFNRYIRKYE